MPPNNRTDDDRKLLTAFSIMGREGPRPLLAGLDYAARGIGAISLLRVGADPSRLSSLQPPPFGRPRCQRPSPAGPWSAPGRASRARNGVTEWAGAEGQGR